MVDIHWRQLANNPLNETGHVWRADSDRLGHGDGYGNRHENNGLDESQEMGSLVGQREPPAAAGLAFTNISQQVMFMLNGAQEVV